MVVSIHVEKAFNKIQHAFMFKVLEGIGLEGTSLNIMKPMYNRPTTKLILNGEKLEAFPLKSGILARLPPIPTPFQYSI